MAKDYPGIQAHLEEMIGRLAEQAPEVMEGFGQLHSSSTADGALETKTKELLALAIGIAVHCDGCISYHTHDALRRAPPARRSSRRSASR